MKVDVQSLPSSFLSIPNENNKKTNKSRDTVMENESHMVLS